MSCSMKRREYWRILSATTLAAACVCSWSSAQVHFPLHVGDGWGYYDHYSILCEGTDFLVFIVGDTVIDGRTYLWFDHSPFSGPFVRADSARVFEYDTTTRTEYVRFDFQAKRGDTLSVRDQGSRVMIALGSLTFGEGTVTYTVRDSVGVVRIYDSGSLCDFKLAGAWINGQRVTLGIPFADPGLPKSPSLDQNYPNPFNPTTTIRFALPRRSHVTLSVFNTLGQQVATLVNAVEEPGEHSVRFDGGGLASGVYFYRLRAGDYVATKRFVLVR
jgi:hypothetical protein